MNFQYNKSNIEKIGKEKFVLTTKDRIIYNGVLRKTKAKLREERAHRIRLEARITNLESILERAEVRRVEELERAEARRVEELERAEARRVEEFERAEAKRIELQNIISRLEEYYKVTSRLLDHRIEKSEKETTKNLKVFREMVKEGKEKRNCLE